MGDFIPGIWDFYPGNWGFLSPGIRDFVKSGDFHPRELWFLSPGIGDFFQIRDFYPGNWGFFSNQGFLSQELGIFFKSEILIPGIGDFWGIFIPGIFRGMGIFFVGWKYPTKKPPLILIESLFKLLNIIALFLLWIQAEDDLWTYPYQIDNLW